MAVIVPGRFEVEAVSRHPRLGRDYDPVTHRYADEYLNPSSYGVAVDGFPGKTLLISRADQQLEPGGDPKTIRDIWALQVPPGTIGFEFSIKGTVVRQRPLLQPLRQPFSAKATKRLVTLRGVFNDAGDNNAWNWRVDVPGPGFYEVSMKTLNTSGGGRTQSHKLAIRDHLVVSIGDSAASGQGNPDVPGSPRDFDPDIELWEVFVLPVALYKLTKEALDWGYNRIKQNATTLARAGKLTIAMDPKPIWQEPKAYRSLRSGHAHAARLLENRSDGRVVTFLPFGRTGSTISAGLLGPRSASADRWIGGLGQVAEVAGTVGNKRIDALLIYIGVNDVGVAGRLEDLIKSDLASFTGKGDAAGRRKAVEATALKNMAKIPANLDKLKTALRTLNVRHVYLTEYPAALFDGPTAVPTKGCGIFTADVLPLDLSTADARLIKELAVKLNNLLEKEAKRLNWFYVSGIEPDFAGHGYCTKNRFFVQAEESMVLQGDTEGTIHPNPDGVKVIGKRVAARVLQNTIEVPDGGLIGRPGQVVVKTGGAAAPATAKKTP